MASLLNILSGFAFFAWRVLMGLLSFCMPKSALLQYLNTEVTANKAELRALDSMQAATISKMEAPDQILLFFSQLPLTQAKAAKRRYWKNANPSDYAKLYNKLGYSSEEAEKIMCEEEKMPGYFRKKVHSRLYGA